MYYDVFNGDADGIFALHQLRLAQPVPEAELVTGIKRDINLLKKIVSAHSSRITVLDISLDKNRHEVETLLHQDNTLLYIDHHFAGDIPKSASLETHIQPSAQTCTSLIVNQLLNEQHPLWAICGAYGDNLHDQAAALALKSGLKEDEILLLREIGELFNYNGYGAKLVDLLFHPAELYRLVRPFSDPFQFSQETEILTVLKKGYDEDMKRARNFSNISQRNRNRIYTFPAESWSRRVAGVFSNLKARQRKEAAHAIIVENDDTTLQISVRAPLANRENADTLCMKFPTGGGRAAAAGINHLPPEMLEDFIEAFESMYSGNSVTNS